MDRSETTRAFKILGSFALAFLGIAMVLFFGGALLLMLFSCYLGHQSENWPSTEGTIVSTEIERVGGSYDVDVEFTYDVGGETHQRCNIGFGRSDEFATRAEAERFLAEYPEKSAVLVYYDPNHPGYSTLKPGWDSSSDFRGVLAFAGVLLLVGVGLTVVGVRKFLRNYWLGLSEARQRRQNRTPAQRRKIALGYMLAAAMITALAGVGFYGGRYAERRARDAAAWPSTKGRIASSEVRWVKPRRSFGSNVAFVTYRFAVDGQKYVGDTLKILPGIQSSQETAEQTVARLHAGVVVDVFYDPGNPHDAVLDNKVDEGGTRIINHYPYMCLIGIGLAIISFVVGVYKFRRANDLFECGPVETSRAYVPQTPDYDDLNVAVDDALRRYAQM
jgi:hypothetical protein